MNFSVNQCEVLAGSKIIFACRDCRSTFQALHKRSFNVGAKSFNCSVCDKIVHRWHGEYDYVGWHPT